MKAYKIARALYLMIGLADVMARAFSWMEINQYTKPLLMPMLIYYLIEKTDGKVYKYHLVLAAGLIFSWIGDVSLMWDSEINFLVGLGAFLICQVIYILIYRIDIQITFKEFFTQKILVFLGLLAYGAVFLTLLIPVAASTFVAPIIIYSMRLLAMTLCASLRDRNVLGYKEVLIGSLIFALSDSVLAYNKFVGTVLGGEAIVMATYIVAQFLIVHGIARKDSES